MWLYTIFVLTWSFRVFKNKGSLFIFYFLEGYKLINASNLKLINRCPLILLVCSIYIYIFFELIMGKSSFYLRHKVYLKTKSNAI